MLIDFRHVYPNKICWHIYHGSDRNAALLGNFDIIFTTYKILSLEWKRHSKLSLFSYVWHRVVLDEGTLTKYLPEELLTRAAHLIKNRATSIAKSACALHAMSRWAISGTPIQNNLKDLASIFEFIQVYPFSNPKVFDAEIHKPWRQLDRRGFCTLKAVVDMVSLCRTKKVVDLPNRIDEIHYLEFSKIERQAYESAKAQTAQLFEEAVATDLSKKGTYLNALQWLNSLRLICNHGVLHLKQKSGCSAIETSTSWNSSTAQKAFEEMIDAGVVECAGCSMNPAEALGEESSLGTADFPKPILSQCLCLFCGYCLLKRVESPSKTICTHRPQCPTAEVSLTGFPVFSQVKHSLPVIKPAEVPPKIRALIADFQGGNKDEKRCVPLLVLRHGTDHHFIASSSPVGLTLWIL